MTIDRELLWLAYPEGFLPVRGVASIDGWLVRKGANERGGLEWCPPQSLGVEGRYEVVQDARERGDLLPAVDPRDRATWACCLADLAEGLDILGPPYRTSLLGLRWSRNEDGVWRLSDGADGAGGGCLFDGIGADIDDPALALVAARASLRSERRGA